MNIRNNKVCRSCGKPIPDASRHTTVCPECAAKNRAAARYKMRTCSDCGKEFMGYPKSKRCPECQAAADKRNNAEHWRRARKGKSRVIGQMYKCEICGKEYMLTSGAQKYCPDCKEAATKARDAALTREWIRTHPDEIEKRKYVARVCVICGKPIPRGSKKVTCGSPECIKARRRQQRHAADARRGVGKMPDDYIPTKIVNREKKTPQKSEKKTEG